MKSFAERWRCVHSPVISSVSSVQEGIAKAKYGYSDVCIDGKFPLRFGCGYAQIMNSNGSKLESQKPQLKSCLWFDKRVKCVELRPSRQTADCRLRQIMQSLFKWTPQPRAAKKSNWLLHFLWYGTSIDHTCQCTFKPYKISQELYSAYHLFKWQAILYSI